MTKVCISKVSIKTRSSVLMQKTDKKMSWYYHFNRPLRLFTIFCPAVLICVQHKTKIILITWKYGALVTTYMPKRSSPFSYELKRIHIKYMQIWNTGCVSNPRIGRKHPAQNTMTTYLCKSSIVSALYLKKFLSRNWWKWLFNKFYFLYFTPPDYILYSYFHFPFSFFLSHFPGVYFSVSDPDMSRY
jgi:hypothetical protein